MEIKWKLLFTVYAKPGSSSDSFQVPLGYILGSVYYGRVSVFSFLSLVDL